MRTYDYIIEGIETMSRWASGSKLQLLSDNEAYWSASTGAGTGYITAIRLRPGMVMAFADLMIAGPIVEDYQYASKSYISFAYSTAGELSLRNNATGNPFYSNRGGYEILSAFPNETGRSVVPCTGTYKCVSIYVEPSLFFDFFPRMEDFIPPALLDIVRGKTEQFFYQEQPATANVQMAMRDIMTCPYKGPYRRLLLESKAMELMTHTLWRSWQQTLEAHQRGLRPGDIERVSNAKKIMDLNFREDIKLLDLAHQVGLPHTKLNHYFRQLHGTTVFGYLRELRMDEARFLLSKGDANVTEAAYAVGYSSLSHFAKVFKKYCGQAPGDFMRHASRRS